jgi:hypothetical protein
MKSRSIYQGVGAVSRRRFRKFMVLVRLDVEREG